MFKVIFLIWKNINNKTIVSVPLLLYCCFNLFNLLSIEKNFKDIYVPSLEFNTSYHFDRNSDPTHALAPLSFPSNFWPGAHV